MDRLILMRHGKAERHAAAGGGDFERALAASGRDDAALMGRALVKAGVAPDGASDRAIVSTARRTRETWEALGLALPAAAVEFRPDLYHADAAEILAAIRDAAPEAGALMIVGHNPGLHELALRMALGGPADSARLAQLRGKFPTATTVVFAIDAAGAPALTHLLYASDHGGNGGE